MRKNLGTRLFGMNVVFCTISNECCARFGNESGEVIPDNVVEVVAVDDVGLSHL